jgi:hypothetical protein
MVPNKTYSAKITKKYKKAMTQNKEKLIDLLLI